jgi:S-formylglutathione hydrolase
MTFSVFIPEPPTRTSPPPPVLYFLSGLTCSDENAKEKAAIFQHAAKAHLAVVWPDTSARGVDIAGQDDSWDFGTGAGFYVNATTEAYSKHYNMETYVTEELPDAVSQLFRVDTARAGITGHSMGGHGALSLHFKHPGMYKSVSAFAPISNPTQCNWGIKAFTGYLGSVEAGKAHDATELVATYAGPQVPILVDQGAADQFVSAEHDQLRTQHFAAACAKAKYPLNLRMQPGYGHDYYWVQTFVGDHVEFHARHLGAEMSF